MFRNIYPNEDKNNEASTGSKRKHRTTLKEHKGSAFTTQGTAAKGSTDVPKSDTEHVPNKSNVKYQLCKEGYWLSRCQVFRGKSVDEQVSFLCSRGLCENCPMAGHVAMSCPKQSYCQIVGCKIGHRKHSSFFFHVERWFYLNDIYLSRIDADIELLIGNDVPKTLEPQEVQTIENDGPYAVQTLLGWTINGPLGRQSKSSGTTNRIQSHAALDQQFARFCKMEFNDSQFSVEKGMSQDDKRALAIMEESAEL